MQDIFARATAAEGDFSVMPRAMTVFAHPDDETIALGARLRRFAAAHFVQVTDGAPQNEEDSRSHGFQSLQDYRQARADELDRALHLAGLRAVSRECLNFPDQLASFDLYQLTLLIFNCIRSYQPDVVFTHPYEGGHPDHDACAFAVQHAIALQRSSSGRVPLLIEAAFYHAGPTGIRTGAFLPSAEPVSEIVHPLTPGERARKEALLACFITQQQTLRQFSCEAERFRIAPGACFHTPPHPGLVFYDHYAWGMTSQRFCELAQRAESALGQSKAAA